jgi:hypothetical protein
VSAIIPTKEQATRSLRIIHIAFIAAMFLQLYVLISVRKPQHDQLDRTFVYGIMGVALASATACLAMRFFLLPKIDEEAAAIDTVWPRRQSFYIIAFALCESVWLFGFVLSFMGEPLSTAFTFLAIAVILMILCFPRQV